MCHAPILRPKPGYIVESIYALLGTFILLTVPGSIYGQSLVTSRMDGHTPSALTAGSPAGSYPLSDFESVNPYNGGLNIHFPLVAIGGRGSAGYTMMLPIQNRWNVEHTFWPPPNPTCGPLCPWQNEQTVPLDFYMPVLVPVSEGYGPGKLELRISGEGYTDCSPSADPYYQTTLTRLTFTAGDGTQIEFRDSVTGGQPRPNPMGSQCTTGQGFNRGKVFFAGDGSAATFISDTDIRDFLLAGDYSGIGATGNLLLADGSTYRVESGQIVWMRDRNGNKVTPTTDSLGRQVTVTRANSTTQFDQISYKGFGGASRTIKVWYGTLSQILRVTGPADSATIKTYQQLFPGLSLPNLSNYNFDPELVKRLELPDGRSYRFFYNVYGELARIELPTGGAIEYDHDGGLSGGTSGLVNGANPGIYRRVIERRVYTDATNLNSLESRTSFSRPQIRSVTDYDDFVDVKSFDAAGNVLSKVRHFYLSNAGISFFLAHFPNEYTDWHEGREYKTEFYNANNTLLRRVEDLWEQTSAGVAENNPHITRTTTTLADVSPNLISKQEFTYDQYNNQTDVYEYDFGSGAPGPLRRTTHTDYVTATTYTDAVTGAHLRRLPVQTSVYDVAGVERARSSFEYDNYSSPPNHASLVSRASISGFDSNFSTSYATRGNITAATMYLLTNGSVTGSIAAYRQYDIAGNLVKAIDARGFTTDFDFSDRFGAPNGDARANTSPTELGSATSYAFVTKVTNALGHQAYTQFDYYLGQPVDSEDANGIVDSAYFNDNLDRPTQVKRAVGTGIVNQITFAYDDIGRVITTTSDLDASRTLVSKTLYDGLGRTVESRTYEGGTNYIVVKQIPFTMQQDPDTGAWMHAMQSSNPYRPYLNEQPAWTTTFFDELDRIIKLRTPDNAIVRTSYSANTATVKDQAGKQRKSVTDALGRLVEVYEDPTAMGLNYQTSYLYDTLDNLVKVTQDSQQRFFMYDSLKRLIRARNPEQGTFGSLALTDSLTGNSTWSVGYQYDANSNLTQKTDARGVVSTYAYDALNRNTTIDYSDTAAINPDVTRFYDGAINGIGRFWYFYSGGDFSAGNTVEATAIDSYDALGRPLVKRQISKLNGTWSTTYQTSRTYNLSGGVTSQTYPSGHTVTYSYDAAGRTSSFTGNLGDGVNRTYATNISYSPFGGLTWEQFGTNTPLYHKSFYNIRGQLFDTRVSSVNDTWDWNRGRQILHYSSNHVWGQSGTDNNGNVLNAETWIPPENATLDQADTLIEDVYSYDALNRLSSVSEQRTSVATGWGTWFQQFRQQYTYDRYGNRTIDVAQAWGTGINNKQFTVDTATNRLGAPSGQAGVMSYDNAGNLTTDTYTGTGSRTYDAENRMTTATDNTNQVSRYTYDADGKRVRRQVASSQEQWQIYGIDGELIAEYEAGAPASAPEKEYGYRGGQLLITASGRFNVALAANGAVASASTAHTCCGFSTTGAINGNYRGPWANGEGWNDATPDAVPDWIQVSFAGSKTIDEIDVFSLHDNYTQENTPTETQTFTLYGLLGFDVQYWNGSSWVTIPGGSVTGNNKVWRKFTFSPVTTSKIRVWINQVPDSWSRVVEIQAFGTSAGGEKVQWLVPDHLGTPRMIVDETGSLTNLKRHDYLPFGEELFAPAGSRTTAQGYSGGDGIRQQFTSKERDVETGLDFFGARYYASIQGRFAGADPLFIEAKRLEYPQGWNLYAYTRNNPLRFIDPDGLEIAVNCQVQGGCQKTVENLNNRKDAQFQTELKDGKLKVVGQVDEKKLSKSEMALYQAITNTDTVATVEVVSASDKILFGYSALNNIPPLAGLNRIDQGDLNQLDQVVAGEIVAHEVMEAFGSKKGLSNYQLAHAYANTFFGDIKVEQVGGLPEGAQMATTARATLNFRRLQTKVSLEITLTTPQPAQSLPNRFDYLQGNIKVVKPEEKKN